MDDNQFKIEDIAKFFKKIETGTPQSDGGQEIRIDSFPGMGGQTPALPEVEDLSAQIPDITQAVKNPDEIEYIDVCASCGLPDCRMQPRRRIARRR